MNITSLQQQIAPLKQMPYNGLAFPQAVTSQGWWKSQMHVYRDGLSSYNTQEMATIHIMLLFTAVTSLCQLFCLPPTYLVSPTNKEGNDNLNDLHQRTELSPVI